ncbi:MAG: hypothetical protein H8E46_09590 [FCB group bacterium]|nr:hypothetical protein [FCB group bacterium]
MPEENDMPLHYRRYSAISGSFIKKIPQEQTSENQEEQNDNLPEKPEKPEMTPSQHLDKLKAKLDEKIDQVEVLTEFVKIAYELKAYDDIIEYSKTFLRIHPRDNGIRFNVGMVLLRVGEVKKAKLEFRQILRYNPRFKQARDVLDKMREEKSV